MNAALQLHPVPPPPKARDPLGVLAETLRQRGHEAAIAWDDDGPVVNTDAPDSLVRSLLAEILFWGEQPG